MAGDTADISTLEASMEMWDLLINALVGKDTAQRHVPQIQNLTPKLLCPWANSSTSLIFNFLTWHVVI